MAHRKVASIAGPPAILTLAIASLAIEFAWPDHCAGADDRESKAAWGRLFDGHARDYVITRGQSQAKLLPEPVLRWSERIRGTDDGCAYLWTDAGRPVAIGTVFSAKNGPDTWTILHEFHSLAAEPLAATWRGKPKWECPGKGVELKALAGSPSPADSGAARLRQMKALASEFSGQTIDRQGKTLELRVLPTPLYRYEPDATGAIDGALFALVQETDPEALLLLEASAEGGRQAWRYAAGSFTNLGLRLSRAGVDLWADAHADRLTGTRGAHVGFVVEKVEGGPGSPAAPKPAGAGR